MRIPEQQQRNQTNEYYATNQAELPTQALDERLAELMDLSLIAHNDERALIISKEIARIVFELQSREAENKALTPSLEAAV